MSKQKDETPEPLSMEERFTQAMEAISARLNSLPSNADQTAIAVLSDALGKLSAAQREIADQQNAANRKIHRPENTEVPKISVFNLRGDKDFPRPDLKCQMFIPYPAYRDDLTREEIELLNLLEPGDYPVELNDGTMVTMTVTAMWSLDKQSMSRIVLSHPTAFKNDNHKNLIPKTRMLREMLAQHETTRSAAASVLTMKEEAALILAGKLNDGTTPENRQVVSVGA